MSENSKNPRFSIEVVENGYILQVFYPERKKTLDFTESFVFGSLLDLQSALEVHINAFAAARAESA